MSARTPTLALEQLKLFKDFDECREVMFHPEPAKRGKLPHGTFTVRFMGWFLHDKIVFSVVLDPPIVIDGQRIDRIDPRIHPLYEAVA